MARPARNAVHAVARHNRHVGGHSKRVRSWCPSSLGPFIRMTSSSVILAPPLRPDTAGIGHPASRGAPKPAPRPSRPARRSDSGHRADTTHPNEGSQAKGDHDHVDPDATPRSDRASNAPRVR
jgi:hypothetical protein